MNLKVVMITGDNDNVAKRVALYVGIEPNLFFSNAYPDDKRRIIEGLQSQGE